MCIYEPLHGEMPTEAICKNGCGGCPFNVPDIPKPENEQELKRMTKVGSAQTGR